MVSAKAITETDINDQFRVKVSIAVQQYDEKKTISRSFIVKKTGLTTITTSSYSFEGIEENDEGERVPIDGNRLLEQIFPSAIRKYSMFKGEAELNIFKNDDALINLINSFSSAKHYDKYSEKGAFLREKAEKAVDDATRSDNRNQQVYKQLEAEIARLISERNKISVFINSTEDQIRKTEENIQEAEKYVTNAEALDTINSRINRIEQQISDTSKRIDENYTTKLFDENWILVNFEKIHHEFSQKVAELSRKKRELQTDFDRKLGIKEGKNLLKAELMNKAIPCLLVFLPKRIWKKCLRELCKVCNRPAEEGVMLINSCIIDWKNI